jgi:hypothetical protein
MPVKLAELLRGKPSEARVPRRDRSAHAARARPELPDHCRRSDPGDEPAEAVYRSWAIACAGRDVYYIRHRAQGLEKLREPGVKMALIVFVGVAMLFALGDFAHVR